MQKDGDGGHNIKVCQLCRNRRRRPCLSSNTHGTRTWARSVCDILLGLAFRGSSVWLTPVAGTAATVVGFGRRNNLKPGLGIGTGRVSMTARSWYVSNRTLHLPGCVLGRVGLNSRGSWRAVVAVRCSYCECFAAIFWSLRETTPRDVAVTFEDFLACDFGIFLEQGRITQD